MAIEVLKKFSTVSVELAEEELLALPQADCPVIHHFGPGIYIRELSMKAGTLAIGHHQKFAHVNIVLQGKVAVLNTDGSIEEVCAPAMFVGKPGRKIGWVLEDVVWQNIYATELTDVDALEAHFLDKSLGWSVTHMKAMLEHTNHIGLNEFKAMLDEYGFTEEEVWKQSENAYDQMPMPMGSWRFKISDSLVHGKGVFATMDMVAHDVVGPARLNGLRTPLGRYTNHSNTPNAVMHQFSDGEIILVATGHIRGCKGGQNGDEITIDYRQALALSGLLLKDES